LAKLFELFLRRNTRGSFYAKRPIFFTFQMIEKDHRSAF
jgi:hypothetical protein